MEELTYKNFIDNIINTRGRFACGDEYHERHHIVPKCMGGTDDNDNLIDLYAREHFEAHRLLALENPYNDKLVYAWHLMSIMNDNNNRTYEITSEEYEEAKKYYSTIKSLTMLGEKHPNYGKHLSEETRKKMSEAASGENNHNFGKSMPDKIRKKISESTLGENAYWYGKHHTDESKKKMSEANSGENHPQCRPVYCYELNEYFWGAKEAQDKYEINGSSIARCCLRKLQSAGKHPITGEKLHWVYTDEMNNSFVA